MTLRFGVVGTAHWARQVHLPGLLAAGAEVAGIWGRTPQTTEAIARERGVRAFASFEALLDACDAVTMAVPPDVQAGLALQAAAAGKHLIVEKPLTRDLASARLIAQAVADRGTVGLVFFARRFIPEVAAAIASEQAHPWTRAAIRIHSGAMAGQSPYSGSVWRQAAGAALWDIGPHALSVLIPMLGPVTQIEADRERDGVCVFRTRHARGGVATVSMSLRSAPGDIGSEHRFVSPTREVILPEPEFSRVDNFARAVRQLGEAVRNGRRDLPCGLDLGVDVVAWLEQAQASQVPAPA